MRNELILGDCLEVMPMIKDKSVDLILCDLPYGTTKAKWDCVIDMPTLWTQYNRIIKDNGAILLFAQLPFDKLLACSNLKNLRYEWVWEKTQATGHLNAKKMPMKAHEVILVFYKKLPSYSPIMTKGHPLKTASSKNRIASIVRNADKSDRLYGLENTENIPDYRSTERYPRSVIRFKTDKQKSNLHPTQKPVALLEYLIKTYTEEGELVLDNCSGSGSVGEACLNTNRDFLLIEKELNYVLKAEKRLDVKYLDSILL